MGKTQEPTEKIQDKCLSGREHLQRRWGPAYLLTAHTGNNAFDDDDDPLLQEVRLSILRSLRVKTNKRAGGEKEERMIGRNGAHDLQSKRVQAGLLDDLAM